MAYGFYGWQNAAIQDELGLTPRDYYDLLSQIWSADTCAPRMRQNWSPENKTLGQCSITAFLLQDIYGGEVYGVPLGDGNYHCFNVVGDCVFDLTSEQFEKQKLNYVNCPKQERSIHFAKAEKKARYIRSLEHLEMYIPHFDEIWPSHVYHTNIHAFDMLYPDNEQSIKAIKKFERCFAEAIENVL